MTILFFFTFGLGIGFLFFWGFFAVKKKGFEALGNKILEEADKHAEITSAKQSLKLSQEDFKAKQALEEQWHTFLAKMHKEESRIKEKELTVEKRATLVEKRISDVEKKQKDLARKNEALTTFEANLKQKEIAHQKELETFSDLSEVEAKQLLLHKLETSLDSDKVKRTAQNLKEIQERAESDAKKVIATAIGRMSMACTSELTVATVPLPNDMIKRRIIGREGRNIRYLEELCGVNLVIDDTPSTIAISGFDPIRKEVAKNTLKHLIQDGRIHPTKIEEVFKTVSANIDHEIETLGREAALESGISSLHPELISLLGKLHFRSSVGQNVLKHSIEVSQLLGLIALELKLDVDLAKRIGLLHDIGKALPLVKEMSHALAGQEFALTCNESKEVANGIGCHHDETAPITLEGSLCSAADAISSARPGARSLSLEKTFKRMKDLEALSLSLGGVVQAFALQAGRELRVVVSPQEVDDAKAAFLAKELAQQIEEKIPHSGKIKITVLRQSRAVSYAL